MAQQIIDDNGIGCFVDNLGVTCFVDDQSNTLCCGSKLHGGGHKFHMGLASLLLGLLGDCWLCKWWGS